jgi:hypothetical protein
MPPNRRPKREKEKEAAIVKHRMDFVRTFTLGKSFAQIVDYIGLVTEYATFVLSVVLCVSILLSIYGYGYQVTGLWIDIDTISHFRERHDFEAEFLRVDP